MVGGTGCCCSCCLGLDRCVAGCAAAPVSCCSRKRNLGLGCLVFVSLHWRHQSVGRGLEERHNCSWIQLAASRSPAPSSCIQHSFRTPTPNQTKPNQDDAHLILVALLLLLLSHRNIHCTKTMYEIEVRGVNIFQVFQENNIFYQTSRGLPCPHF